MSYFNDIATIRARAGLGLAAVGAAVLIAGCGSSGSSTIGVNNQNKSDEGLAKSTAPTSSTGSTAARTPTSGPLSKEPKVTPPAGAAPSKLVVKDIVVGTGPEAKLGKSVTVNYVGVLYHGGKIFDASWEHGEPAVFALEQGKLIRGWTDGIPGMKVGGRRELVVPAPLAYGAKGAPPAIPPNAPLVFVVDLLGA